MSDPTITTSVKETESGKVEEITGTSADAGELYVIRLTPNWMARKLKLSV